MSEQTATDTDGSLVKASTAAWRALVVWSPRMDTYVSPRSANTFSAASITSMCFAKKTTLPTLCTS